MISSLLAYDQSGTVIATLDHMVAQDEDGKVIGLLDFEAHELAGGKLRDFWEVSNAIGSGTWPEWLGIGAHAFRVELDAQKHISALIHLQSVYRRERAAILAAIEATVIEDGFRDIRPLVGGPQLPLSLDEEGHTVVRPRSKRKTLPMIGYNPHP